jgi:5-deoxy-D-glucuronate isomerase
MRHYTADNLVIHPCSCADPDVIVQVTPEAAGWESLYFQARRLAPGRSWTFATEGHELALVVLIPEGYHPVSSPVGYTTYYLNVLAGSAQSLASEDDPRYAWVKGSYRTLDSRVPIYEIAPPSIPTAVPTAGGPSNGSRRPLL